LNLVEQDEGLVGLALLKRRQCITNYVEVFEAREAIGADTLEDWSRCMIATRQWLMQMA